jgi:hypothetical protein
VSGLARTMSTGRITSFFFLSSLFCVTFEKIHWSFGADVSLADVLAAAFVLVYALAYLGVGRRRLTRTGAILLCFLAAFALVYLIGFFNLDSQTAEHQFAKGLVKFVVHFLFLLCGLAWLARRSQGYYWRALGWFVAGLAFNCAYGVVQLLAARSGVNLDSALLSPLTGGASAINLYGIYNGASIFRINALTGDPNHLGIMLDLPLLVLTPLFLRLERDHPWRRRLTWLIAFFLLVEVATLSRSGILGLLVGFLVLTIPYRRKLFSRTVLAPVGGVAALLLVVFLARLSYFEKVLSTRVETGGSSTSAHFGVYDFIPQILNLHPLFGLGLNTFSVYYEAATGKTNWGPHSFYVSLIVETGLVGTLVFAAFLWFLFGRLGRARLLGRTLVARRDPLASRVMPLAWGMTAALAGTMAANVFYLTMSFYYFYAFALLALAVPVVFARHEPEPRVPGTSLRA